MTTTFVSNQPKVVRGNYRQECTVWLAKEVLLQLSFPPVVKFVCDTVKQEQFDSAYAYVKAKSPNTVIEMTNLAQISPKPRVQGALPKPIFGEPMVAASDQNGNETLAWNTQLITHARHSQHPGKCLVLWGPPGVGKTLATERLAEMLERLKSPAAPRGRQLTGTTTLDRSIEPVPEMRRFSFADATDADDVTTTLLAMKQFSMAAKKDSVISVDDTETLTGAQRQSLIDLLVKSKCRCILVVDNMFSLTNKVLYRSKLAEHFFGVYVGSANPASLTKFVKKHFQSLDDATVDDIVEDSQGDVRAALVEARMTVLSGSKIRRTLEKRGQKKLDVALTGTLHHDDVGSAAREQFYESDGDIVAELLYANCPRYLSVPGKPETDILDAAADALDMFSRAAAYDDHRRENFFSGSDGEAVDKNILFSLQIETPLHVIKKAIGQTYFFQSSPYFDTPLRKLYATQQHNAELMAFFTRHETADVGKEKLSALENRQLEVEGLAVHCRQTAIAFRLLDMGGVLLGDLRRSALSEALAEAALIFTKRVADLSTLTAPVKRIVAIVHKASVSGIGAEALALLCMYRLRVDDTAVGKLTHESLIRLAGWIIDSLEGRPDLVFLDEPHQPQDKKRPAVELTEKQAKRKITSYYNKAKGK